MSAARPVTPGRPAAALLALLLAGAARPLAAQREPLTGFTPQGSAAERALEADAVARIAPAELDSFSYALTRRPHVAGSPEQAATRDWVLDHTRDWGLRSESKGYSVYLPWPTALSLEMIVPEHRAFELHAQALEGDPTSALPQFPWVNGYSGTGTAVGPLVYVNYGLYEDYAALDSLGVSVKGRVVLARYGRSYRGIKARLAQQHGASALIIYSDPEDDGFVRGDVFPDGPYRNPSAAQRGSVLNGDGDPTTPGWPSTSGAKRVDPTSTPWLELPTIPVIPVSYRVAEPLLRALHGADLPQQAWQGGLPFRYHVGPGPAAVRVTVADDRATRGMKDIWNTVAWVPGSERPGEWIVIGGHRDAWDAGANDNVSGTSAVLAAARAVAELAREGKGPRRTLVFATWDAEEWGLTGSVEWVEEMADQLGANAVAYINQDAIASGARFGASASPSLKAFVRGVTRAVTSPEGGTVYDHWREEGPPAPAADGDVALGNLGGGSDFAGFYNHLGIPSASWGFGGGSGEYHSTYDDYTFESEYGDPGFVHHAASARLAAVAALRLADAAVLPYDYGEFARELRAAVFRLQRQAVDAQLDNAALVRLDSAFARMEEAAAAFAGARDAALVRAAPPAALDSANRHLMLVERSMTRPEGLPGRPWMKNLAFASDFRNGYATIVLPAVAEAIRAADAGRMAVEADDLARRVAAATEHLRQAAAALR